MNDLISELRQTADELDCNRYAAHVWVIRQAADRLTAMKAAGDGLAGFAGHSEDCASNDWKRPCPCDCLLGEAIKQWKEASDGL